MNKKLTLSVPEDVVDRAKVLATSSGRSLSSIVTDLLMQEIKKNKSNKTIKAKAAVKDLVGFLDGLDPDLDYKKEYKEYRANKV